MKQINEVELKNIAKSMNGKSIQVQIKGIIMLDFTIHKVHCRYRGRSGILYIHNRETNIMLSMETFMAYMLKTSENRQIIEIRMENDEVVTLHII